MKIMSSSNTQGKITELMNCLQRAHDILHDPDMEDTFDSDYDLSEYANKAYFAIEDLMEYLR